MKKQGCLMTALKILGIIILIPVLIAFGWIAGAIWLLFFRKKLNDNPEKQKKMTIIVSVLSALSLIIMIISLVTYKPLKSIEISSDVNGQELEVNQDYIIDVSYAPENASVSDFIYNVDSFCATFEKSGDDNGKAVLHTKSEGTVTISVSSGTIDSNSLTFTIVDSAKKTDISNNFLMDYKLTVENVLNGSGDTVIGEYAFIHITDEEFEKITPDILKEFAENVVNDSGYNWVAIMTSSDTGICFTGSDVSFATYGKMDKDGSILEAIGMWTLDADGNYIYEGKEDPEEISTDEVTEMPSETNGTEEANPAASAAEPVSDNTNAAAEPVNEAESENPPETVENTEMVWLSATGDKYHSIPNCGRMNPDKARQVTREQAESSGHSACTKCY